MQLFIAKVRARQQSTVIHVERKRKAENDLHFLGKLEKSSKIQLFIAKEREGNEMQLFTVNEREKQQMKENGSCPLQERERHQNTVIHCTIYTEKHYINTL